MQRPTLRLYADVNITGMLSLHFGTRTNWRGTDFSVYSNTGYTANEDDAPFTQKILEDLVNDPDSLIRQVNVSVAEMTVYCSKAVSPQEIVNRVLAACQRAGYDLVLVDDNGQPLENRRTGFWSRYFRKLLGSR